MRSFRALYRASGAGFEMPKPDSPKKAKAYATFGLVAFLLILVPSTIGVGYIVYMLSNLLLYFGERSYALVSLMHIISAFTMIFLMPVMFNVLFFSDDLHFIRTLPVTPVKLYQARFWHTFRTESFMTVGVLLSMFIGWFVALWENLGASEALSPVTFVSAAAALILVPALPVIYCSILASLLMLVLRKARRTTVFYHASTVMFVLFAFVFLLSFRGQGGANVDNYIDTLVKGTNSFNDVCDVLFFTTPLVVKGMAQHDILSLLGALGYTVAAYLLMVGLARFTYNDGLYVSARLARGKRAARQGKGVADIYAPKVRSLNMTLLAKELRTLARSMTYRTNCVYVNLMWPVATVIFLVWSRRNVNILRFMSLYRGGQPQARVIVLIVVVALAFVASGLNSIASTSFTREGAHIDIIKYLPVPYTRVILAKTSAALILTYIPVATGIAAASVILGSGLLLTLMYLALAFLSVLTGILIGVTMDSVSPYVIWSDEAASLRGNMNTFFNLAAQLLVAAAVCGGVYLIYILLGRTIWCDLAAAIMLVLLCATGLFILVPAVRRNMEKF
ncbi:ABC-2 type transport system permease protein [Ruminococcaceae bacterium YRB3002]|nr:ABC-2 type transport system permease protein [Ruminococcaceae bacterium YRB3002]